MPNVYVYIGAGEYMIGIPARDMTQTDIDGLGLTAEGLIATGLYKAADEPIAVMADPEPGPATRRSVNLKTEA